MARNALSEAEGSPFLKDQKANRLQGAKESGFASKKHDGARTGMPVNIPNKLFSPAE